MNFYRCRGTTKWVHQACIQRWVDEKQKGNTSVKVECPQCGTTYVIRFPKPTFVVAILDSGDMLIQKLCPIITGGVCVGSIYWTMVTFGAVTGKWFTMLQKLSKCEVKALTLLKFDNFTVTQILREIKFW